MIQVLDAQLTLASLNIFSEAKRFHIVIPRERLPVSRSIVAQVEHYSFEGSLRAQKPRI